MERMSGRDEQHGMNITQQEPKEESIGKMKEETPGLVDILRILRAEIISCKKNNENIYRDQEEVNFILLKILYTL